MTNASRSVLVTGGAGFIGSAVARRLLHDGDRVTVFDDLSTGYIENVPQGASLVKVDLGDRRALEAAFASQDRFDAILHLAAQSGGTPSFDDPIHDLRANTVSTLGLLDIARRTNAKFILASSMAVYGHQSELPIFETSSPAPLTPYAVSKFAAENYVRVYSELGVDGTTLRLNNVYGPGQDLGNLQQGMVSIFVAQAIRDRHIVVRGPGDRFRDFVYIDDVVEAFSSVLRSSRAGDGGAYNVSTGVATTVTDLIEEILRNIPFAVTVSHIAGTPGDQHGTVCSNGLIEQHYGWHPRCQLSQAIEITVRNALRVLQAHADPSA